MSETTTPKKSNRLWQGLRGLWRITTSLLVVVVLLCVAYITWTNIQGKQAASRMLQELKQRGIAPAPLQDLASDDNAARYYLASAELLARNPSPLRKAPYFSSTDWPTFGQALSPDQAQALKQAVEANPTLSQTLAQIRPGDRAQFELDAAYGTPELSEVLSKTRRLARWYQLLALQATAEGDLDRAVDACRGLLQLAQQFKDDDYTVIALVRSRIARLGLDTAQSLLSRAELSESQLQLLQASLEETRSSFVYERVLRTELSAIPMTLIDPDRHIVHNMYQLKILARSVQWAFEDESDDAFENELFKTSTWPWMKQTASVSYASWCPGRTQLSVVDSTHRVLELYDAVTGPEADTASQVELSQKKYHHKQLQTMVVVLRVHLKIKAELSAAIAAMQVEQHRLREGAWPESLADVFETVPAGPYGHSLQMTQEDAERRVYSIGVNGVDDAGANQYNNLSGDGDEDDRVFILLDPDKRNRPATTTND